MQATFSIGLKGGCELGPAQTYSQSHPRSLARNEIHCTCLLLALFVFGVGVRELQAEPSSEMGKRKIIPERDSRGNDHRRAIPKKETHRKRDLRESEPRGARWDRGNREWDQGCPCYSCGCHDGLGPYSDCGARVVPYGSNFHPPLWHHPCRPLCTPGTWNPEWLGRGCTPQGWGPLLPRGYESYEPPVPADPPISQRLPR